jgi:hypothetical protein
MAEVLAIAGVAIGIPGVIDILTKYGEWLCDRAKGVKHASHTWKELVLLGQSLSQGQFKLSAQQANDAYRIVGLDPSLKRSLANQIRMLELDLDKAQNILKEIEPKGTLGKVWFGLVGERRAREALNVLRPHEQALFNFVMLIDKSKPSIEQQIVLGKDRFAVDEGTGYRPVPFTTTLFLASASFKRTTVTRKKEVLTVLIERPRAEVSLDTVAEADIKSVTEFLVYRLPDDSRHPGVLKCLGYRMTPEAELVFELPGDQQPQTLQTLIAADAGKDYGGGHALDYRLQLARKVSLAILTVHIAGLVHKNIRTETILVVKPRGDSQDQVSKDKIGFGDPYLTEWRLLKDAGELSTRRPIASQWWQNIYRHPERQGLSLQDDYNMGHDIYSLGVCLLEIGLWDVLVRTRTASGRPEASELFKKVAIGSEFATPEEVLGMFGSASRVKEILIAFAQRYLPSRMGLTYMRLVVGCLKILDSPSGLSNGIPDFRELNDTEKGLAFQELVLSSFPSDFL